MSDDWTRGPEGASNTSALYAAAVSHVERIIRDGAHTLVGGGAAAIARMIVSNLAHRDEFRMAPRGPRFRAPGEREICGKEAVVIREVTSKCQLAPHTEGECEHQAVTVTFGSNYAEASKELEMRDRWDADMHRALSAAEGLADLEPNAPPWAGPLFIRVAEMIDRAEKAAISLPVVRNCGSCYGAASRETDEGTEQICHYTDEHNRKLESITEPPPAWCPIRALADQPTSEKIK